MDPKTLVAKRIAQELVTGDVVNLGFGLPTLVAEHVPAGVEVVFQAENGLIGVMALQSGTPACRDLVDASGNGASCISGAAIFDSVQAFSFIRGGHLDVTVLGGLQVDEAGHLANWMIPGKMIAGMGGAMDLVTGAKRVIVAMIHTAKGASKIVKECSIPLTSARRVDLIITDLAVIEPTSDGLRLREVAPGVSVEQVLAGTEASLIVEGDIPEMRLPD